MSSPTEIDSASLVDAIPHSNATISMDGLTSSEPLDLGMDADNKFDRLINEFCDFSDSQQCVSSLTATNTAGGEWPTGIAISSDPVLIEDPTSTTVLPFASVDSGNSPSADEQLTSLDPGNTPHPMRYSMDYASTLGSAATLESESGALLYYMTPPSSVGSPLAVQPINP